jgi:sulfur transfer complex TusBCD TusB component (DsrH family)
MKILQIVESAYRGTLEEQDDTILWFSHTLRTSGAELDVLLRGNAVNYAVRGQDASGLSFGAWMQTQPPRIAEDIGKLRENGVTVYLVDEDAAERGICREDLTESVQPISRADLASLLDRYDRVWHW